MEFPLGNKEVGGVGGGKQTKGKRAVKLFCGNEATAYARCDHLLANRKSPSKDDYL